MFRKRTAPGRKKICFVLTVPHATCDEEKYPSDEHHVCDLAAPKAASRLARSLRELTEDTGDVVIGPLYGNINRMKSDLNRVNSRQTVFRKSFAHIVTDYVEDGYDVVVVDVHSFDDNAPWSDHRPSLVFMDHETLKRSDDYFARDEEDSESVYTEEGPTHPGGFLETLCSRLEKIGAMRVMISRSPVNDIVRQAKQLGAKFGVLVEFDETMVSGKRGGPGAFAKVIRNLAAVLFQSSAQSQVTPLR